MLTIGAWRMYVQEIPLWICLTLHYLMFPIKESLFDMPPFESCSALLVWGQKSKQRHSRKTKSLILLDMYK